MFESLKIYAGGVLLLEAKQSASDWQARFPLAKIVTTLPSSPILDRFNIIACDHFDGALFSLLLPGGYLACDTGDEKLLTEELRKTSQITEGRLVLRRPLLPAEPTNAFAANKRVSMATFATPDLAGSLEKHRAWALDWCKQGSLHCFGPHDLRPDFYLANKATLDLPRGAGYWLWKPYVILATLLNGTGEFVAYCDAGSCWRTPWATIEKAFAENPDCHMLCVEHTSFKEREYTKRDTFLTVAGADKEEYANSSQRAATCSVFRRNAASIQFVRDWLAYASVPGIVTDAPNKLGKENYPGFVENRYDQSVYSLMTKTRGGAIVFNYEAHVAQRVFGGGNWHR